MRNYVKTMTFLLSTSCLININAIASSTGDDLAGKDPGTLTAGIRVTLADQKEKDALVERKKMYETTFTDR